MRAVRRSERGEVGVEYVGVGVALTVLIAVLASTGVATSLTKNVAWVFCQAASVVDGRTCERPSSTAADGEEPSLADQAYAGDYVALGDSYSSGEGADDYIEGTNDDNAYSQWAADNVWGWEWAFGDPNNNICRRSENAYSGIVFDQGEFQGDYIFGACSGAISDDYSNPNHGDNEGEGPQSEHITDETSLITLSMGGNDFGFGDVITDCVIHGTTAGDFGDCGSDEATQAAYDRIDSKVDNLIAMYQQMAKDAPDDARILVVGYPQMFPSDPQWPTWGMSIMAQRWINEELLGYTNDAIRRAIAESGVTNIEFVDVSNALAGHEAGTAEPWMHDIVLGFDGGKLVPVSNNSYHPTKEGQNAIAVIVQDAVVNGGEKP